MSVATATDRPAGEVEQAVWVTPREGRAITGLGITALTRMAVRGHVRTYRPPGGMRRYHRGDLERYAPPA